MKSRLFYFCIFVTCFSINEPTFAAPIIDQYYEPEMIDISSPICVDYDALTYTIGMSGRLTQVDLLLGRNEMPIGGNANPSENIILDIRHTDGFAPLDNNSAILASVTVEAHDVLTANSPGFQWVSFDLSSFQLDVSSNDVLAIVLHSDYGLFSNSNVLWGGSVDEGITGIESFFRFPNSTWYVNHAIKWEHDSFGMPIGVDSGPIHYGFRTYVEPVPEPSTLVMLFAGLVGLFLCGKRWRMQYS